MSLAHVVPPFATRGLGLHERGDGLVAKVGTSKTVVECSYYILISLKIAEFRTPTPQDVRKKGSKILKLPRFANVLHLQ